MFVRSFVLVGTCHLSRSTRLRQRDGTSGPGTEEDKTKKGECTRGSSGTQSCSGVSGTPTVFLWIPSRGGYEGDDGGVSVPLPRSSKSNREVDDRRSIRRSFRPLTQKLFFVVTSVQHPVPTRIRIKGYIDLWR